MKMGGILGLVVGGLVALTALLLVSVWLFVNPNAYKPRIAAAFKEATGRNLVLQGDIRLSVFPWIALQLGPASLGNPPGFGALPFASFQHATFRARLLPLLARRLEIGRVEIDGLDVLLIRNAEGRGNWEGTEAAADGVAAGGAGANGGTGATSGAVTASAGTAGGADAAAGAGTGAAGRAGTETGVGAEPGGAGVAGSAGALASTSSSGASPEAADNGHVFAGIAGVKITNSRVSYGPYHVENINLETGAFAEREVVPVALTFDADRGVATEHAAVQARFDLSADLTAKRYQVAALAIHSTVNLADMARPVRWNFSTPVLDVDVGGQTLNVTKFELDLAGAHLSGSVAGREIVDALALSGRVSLAPLVVREFLPRFGVTAPGTRDPKALSLVTASAAYAYGAGGATLDDLLITLDDTHVTGRVGIVNLKKRVMTFALAVDAIDLERYLAPVDGRKDGRAEARNDVRTGARSDARTDAGAEARTGAWADTGAGARTDVGIGARTDATAAAPVTAAGAVARGEGGGGGSGVGGGARAGVGAGAAPRFVDVNGTLLVGAIRMGSMDVTGVKVSVVGSGGVVRLFPLVARVDGGEYSGDVVFDRRGREPVLALDEHLTGIEVGRLVGTGSRNSSGNSSGNGSAYSSGNVHLSGRGTVNLKATGRGVGGEALLRSLNGRVDAVVTGGAVEGVDVGFQLGRAESLLGGQSGAGVQDSHRTPFDVLKMSADIADGVARTRDLTIASPVLKVTGQGSVDLAAQSIDMSLLADTLRTVGGTPIQIPLNVSGALADPSVRPDLEALAKGELRHRVQQLLQDKLKGLFNR